MDSAAVAPLPPFLLSFPGSRKVIGTCFEGEILLLSS